MNLVVVPSIVIKLEGTKKTFNYNFEHLLVMTAALSLQCQNKYNTKKGDVKVSGLHRRRDDSWGKSMMTQGRPQHVSISPHAVLAEVSDN